MRRLIALLCVTAALLPAGCGGGSTNAVEGAVTFQGKPAEGALVIFHPVADASGMGNKPYGTVKADGTFTLTTTSDKPDAGAPAGDYKVTVAWTTPAKADAKAGAVNMGGDEKAGGGADRLGGKYSNAATTTLTATVKSGRNKLEPFALN